MTRALPAKVAAGASWCESATHCAQSGLAVACMKLAQTQIYACDRLVISAGPGRENSSHRHFGAIVTIAPDAPITLMSREAEPIVCRAAIVAPNAWHRIDARNARTVTVLIGPDHPWFRYIKPLLSGEPIVQLDFATLDGRADPVGRAVRGHVRLPRGAARRAIDPAGVRRHRRAAAPARRAHRGSVANLARRGAPTRRRPTSSAVASGCRATR